MERNGKPCYLMQGTGSPIVIEKTAFGALHNPVIEGL